MWRTSAASASDLLLGTAGTGARGRVAGGLERGDEAFDAPADGVQLGSPLRHQLVDAGVALRGPGLSGGDLAGPVGVGVAGLGEVGGDLIGALGEQVADLDGDAGDAPVAQVPRRPVVRLDR